MRTYHGFETWRERSENLAKRIGAELVGDGSVEICAVGAIGAADRNEVAFITDDKHASALAKSQAGAVIVSAAALRRAASFALRAMSACDVQQ